MTVTTVVTTVQSSLLSNVVQQHGTANGQDRRHSRSARSPARSRTSCTGRDADRRVRASYVNDDLLDAHELCDFERPTARDRFQWLALQWFVKGSHSGVKAFVRSRD